MDSCEPLKLQFCPSTKRRQIFILLIFPIFYLCLLLKKQLITEQTVNNMLSWRNSGFSVNATVRVDTIGCRSDIYNSINNLQAHYRWYVTHCR